ncbi:MAG: hypothetical protein H6Q31_204 [Bacteroidetes bacterium]|nr:hypothetical protein [Bacteroidota bacterium]
MTKVPAKLGVSFSVVFQWLAAIALAGCAGQVQPSGGPPDTIPPAIIRTIPDTNAVRVSTSFLELEFSEYVDRRSVEEAVFISPHLGTLEFDWGGTEVRITFQDTLRRNTTYVVTIGTDVVDIRAQNRMARSYTLAFSTGDSLDQGSMEGHVVDERPDGVMVFAYNLDGVDPDTLNPSHTRPDYIVQTGADGKFQLRNTVISTYRVIAVRDEYKNLVYDREVDQYGVSQNDITLTPARPHAAGIWFRLAKEDTTKPFLSSVTASDRYHVLLRFSEAVDTTSVTHAAFRLLDTLSLSPLRLGALYQDMGNPALIGAELIDPLDSTRTYRMIVRGLADRAGNVTDSTRVGADFPGSGIPDTVRPVVRVHNVADSSRGIPLDIPFEIDLGKPVSLGPALASVTLLDSARRVVPANVVARTPAQIRLIPRIPLIPSAWHTIRIVLDSLVDSRGNRYRDSTALIRFQTMDLRVTGTIEGRVLDPGGRGDIVITARSIDLTPPRSDSVRIRKDTSFVIEKLTEGKYAIQGYRDEDENRAYTPGLPHPYKPSERFAVFPDTVKIRARWSIEGVVLKFPQGKE